jgi:hypothetical protein
MIAIISRFRILLRQCTQFVGALTSRLNEFGELTPQTGGPDSAVLASDGPMAGVQPCAVLYQSSK